MVKNINAQEWLNEKYPKEERSKIEEIYLNDPNLESELDLEDFAHGTKVYVSSQIDETKLTFKNLPEYCEIIKLVQAQGYINQEYPTKEIKEKVTFLDIADRENCLEGDLDLSDFVNLKYLFCRSNKLTSLDLNNCSRLEEVNCCNNQLVNLDVSNCYQLIDIDCSINQLVSLALPTNLTNLKKLNLGGNNFFPQDLFFLVKATNLETLVLGNNKFTGSLDYLSEMKQLSHLNIEDTNINEINIDKLPNSLVQFDYSAEKLTQFLPQLEEHVWKDLNPNFRLISRRHWEGKYREVEGFTKKQTKGWIQVGVKPEESWFASWLRDVKKLTPQEFFNDKEVYQELRKKINEHDWCRQCQKPNTGNWWCQPCAEQEWKNLTGRELIDKFFQQQKKSSKIKWIPYEQFSNVEHLANGGFGSVCKAKWNDAKWNSNVVLKILNNSQNITSDLLKEVVNNQLVSGIGGIIDCYGISQDPETKNYIMVIEYVEEGNLRHHLQKRTTELSFWDRYEKLENIASGLWMIHKYGLVHHDFHPGNILSTIWGNSIWKNHTTITDFGLSKLTNYQLEEKNVFGVVPYVAHEVLLSKPYTPASDIYSLGIMAYELFANAYPYYEYKDLSDTDLAQKICQGLRPNIEELKIPQLLKELIKRCWDAEPKKRPSVEELREIITFGWGNWVRKKKEINTIEYSHKHQATEFIHQLQEIEEEYNHWSQNTPYQLPEKAITTSRLIRLFQESEEEAIQAEIKKMEREIHQTFTEDQKELVKNFIETKKKSLKDEENKELMDSIGELKTELRKERFSRKDVGKILEYCERFIKAEQQLAANIEIPTN